jgi:hypothetical protein
MGLKIRLEWYDKETELGEGEELSQDLDDDGSVIKALGMPIETDGFGAATQPSGSKLPRHTVGTRLGYCVVDGNREQARSYRFGGLPEICGVLKTVGATRLASRY